MSKLVWTITGTTVLVACAVFLGFLVVVNDAINRGS